MKDKIVWEAHIDYDALGEAIGSKAKLARARGARSAIRVAGYLDKFTCSKREDALSVAQEITEATGIPMTVDECVIMYL